MPAYTYKASTLEGKILEGVIEAPDKPAVSLRLIDMGLLPIWVESSQKKSLLNREIQWFWQNRKKIRHKDLLIFTQELHTLVKAGFPLDRGLTILGQLSENPALAEVIHEVLKEVKAGKSFSEGLGKFPEVFPRSYVNMIKAGETGGALEEILSRLISFLQTSQDLRSYIVGAMIYPILLSLVGLVSITILTLFVVPKFTAVFHDMGVPVPLAMVILHGLSQLVSGYWWVIVAALALIWFYLRRYRNTPDGRLKWDRTTLRLPVIGAMKRKIEVSRFARTLGTLLHGGVPLLQAMTIVKDIIVNQSIAAAIEPIRNGIKKGEGIAQPMKQSGVFPPLAMHLIEVGEESGRLDSMLTQVADIYDNDVREAVKRIMALFEPVMILVMGIVIGTIVVSMLLAIFSINDIPL